MNTEIGEGFGGPIIRIELERHMYGSYPGSIWNLGAGVVTLHRAGSPIPLAHVPVLKRRGCVLLLADYMKDGSFETGPAFLAVIGRTYRWTI